MCQLIVGVSTFNWKEPTVPHHPFSFDLQCKFQKIEFYIILNIKMIDATIASKNINATIISKIHSIKPPKTLFTNNIPLTVYVRKSCEKDFESTIKYFAQNNIKVNIIPNLTLYVKKAFANTSFNHLDNYFEMIELLVVAGLTVEKSKKSYILASIGFRSVKDFTYLKNFNWYEYFMSFCRSSITTDDDEKIYKLYQKRVITYNNINTTKIYEIVLCATLNYQLKYMKRIAFKSLEKIINLFYDDKSKKTIIVLKSTGDGVKSNIYKNIGFKKTTSTKDGLMFMYKQNTNKPCLLDSLSKENLDNCSPFINPIIVDKS